MTELDAGLFRSICSEREAAVYDALRLKLIGQWKEFTADPMPATVEIAMEQVILTFIMQARFSNPDGIFGVKAGDEACLLAEFLKLKKSFADEFKRLLGFFPSESVEPKKKTAKSKRYPEKEKIKDNLTTAYWLNGKIYSEFEYLKMQKKWTDDERMAALPHVKQRIMTLDDFNEYKKDRKASKIIKKQRRMQDHGNGQGTDSGTGDGKSDAGSDAGDGREGF